MSHDNAVLQFLIQLDWPDTADIDLPGVDARLQSVHIWIDPEYGVVRLDPKHGRYIVRGRATPADRAKAERLIPGVRFFADPQIQPRPDVRRSQRSRQLQ